MWCVGFGSEETREYVRMAERRRVGEERGVGEGRGVEGRGVGQGQGRGIPGGRRPRGVRMRGAVQRRARTRVPDEIRATIIDHVINHGLSYREAGERVQPHLSRDTVASIIRIFRETNR